MPRSKEQLREDALAIWQAGVAAVDSRRLVLDHIQVTGSELIVGEITLPLASIGRIAVVGAGKAGAGMAAGVEDALEAVAAEKQLGGWVNVPEDCVRPLRHITLHGARPAGVNEPTAAGVFGTNQILDLVSTLTADDVGICLLSGGGSALLPAPVEAITLADKLAVTKHLSESGANIEEINTVRKQLSRIKGGGLARACRAGQLITLIISDVLGNPLDVIASGPTVADTKTPADALAVLTKFSSQKAGISPAVFEFLEQARQLNSQRQSTSTGEDQLDISAHVSNFVIGDNALAVDAAGIEAERRGYSHAMIAATTLEGAAEDVGRHLADMARRMSREPGPDCLITGGEPVVRLIDAAQRGKGGRNQQLVLAALQRLLANQSNGSASPLAGICLLSGGTDGEDGPTDAAGAIIDESILQDMLRLALAPDSFLQRNDAYHFFEQLGALLITGPTNTNVCDLRVVTVSCRARSWQ